MIMAFSGLKMTRNSNGFVFKTEDEQLNQRIELRFFNITPNKESVNSFVVVKINDLTVHFSKLNLINIQSKSALAKNLFDLYNRIDWNKIIQACSIRILEEILTKDEAKKIDVSTRREIKWLIEKFIVKQNSTLIFARGGSGKSLIATFLGQVIQNGLQIFGKTEQSNTLYLDWETDEDEIAYKVYGINKHFELDDTFYYMRMSLPLATELEYISNEVVGKNIGFIIIDSATPAVGGDIKDAVATTSFFSAVRHLNKMGVTTLILSHISKQYINEGVDLESQSTPIGSIFFENFPRATYELFSTLNSNVVNEKRLFLIPRKSNIGKLNMFAFDVEFEKENIKFTKLPNAFGALQSVVEATENSSTKIVL